MFSLVLLKAAAEEGAVFSKLARLRRACGGGGWWTIVFIYFKPEVAAVPVLVLEFADAAYGGN